MAKSQSYRGWKINFDSSRPNEAKYHASKGIQRLEARTRVDIERKIDAQENQKMAYGIS